MNSVLVVVGGKMGLGNGVWERRDFEVCVCGGGGTWIQCMGRRDLKIVPGKKGFGGVCVCV